MRHKYCPTTLFVFAMVLLVAILLPHQALSYLAADSDIDNSNATVGDYGIGFTEDEIAWIKEHPVIRLAPDPDFPPLEFLDKNGAYQGIAADFIHLLEKKLPLKFEITILKNWSEVVAQAKNKQIDMWGAAVPTPERLEYMKFTPPFVEFPAVVLVRDSATDFPHLDDLEGKSIAVVANYADHEYMRRVYPELPLEVMPDISSGLRQVSFGKIDSMVLNIASASYYIQKDGINNLSITQDTDFVFDLSFAVRDDWPTLVSILTKGMKSITAEEKQAVLTKWISLEEKSWRPSPLFLITAAAIFLLLTLLLIILWNRSLQQQVRQRTADFEAECKERVQTEKERADLQQQVHQAKRMEAIGMLAGGVAHDLNNILSGSIGYADLLLRKIPEEEKLKRYLYEIRESGRRAAAIVADLLTLSRDAASDRHPVNINTLAAEYLASAEHQSLTERFPQIKFNHKFESSAPTISCSEIHMRKCIMNLIINAAEATSAGNITITTENKKLTTPVTFHDRTLEPGPYVMLSIADDGPGIPAENLEHIFDPFYSNKTLGHSGTGLGLTIVWNTVQDHDGFIEIKQPEKGGTIFALNFPAVKRESNPVSVEDNIDIEGHGEHVLIVDDEETVRTLAKKLLLDLGYQISVVSSGEEAIEFLDQHKVDLLLLDMLMEPGLNGYETFKRIRAKHPQQKAVIASGFSESHEVKKAQALGAGAYLKKPYTLKELGLAVKKELGA